MSKILITLALSNEYNAASKARQDAEAIAKAAGYRTFLFKGPSTSTGSLTSGLKLAWTGWQNWRRLLKEVEPGSSVLVQYPHYPMKSAYLARWLLPWARRKKQLHFTALIHDLNSLRGTFGKAAMYSDHHFLKQFDAVICHNPRMKEELVRWGFDEKRLLVLGLFDYLTDAPPKEHHLEDGVAVAGNLSATKCGYVAKLAEMADYPLHLYGNGLDRKLPGTAQYHGAFPPDELPAHLEGAFGLVWDGPSVETCNGLMGRYLGYNNPHKVSLYLAAGMPVIVWSGSALAPLVEENGIGLKVGRLEQIGRELQNMSQSEYEFMCQNARNLGKHLREGELFNKAIQKDKTFLTL